MSERFTIRRSRRARRARLTLTDLGDVVVVLPMRAAERSARELVARHEGWIARHQRRLAEQRRILADRPALGDGRALSLRGIAHDVFVEPAAAGRRFSSVALEVHSPPAIVVQRVAVDRRSPAALLDRWLRRQARADIELRVAQRAAEMRLDYRRVTIRDQRSRWGSASRRGTLSFSWRLVLCPPEILDYVVVHELAHLRVAGHSAAFWTLVRRHAPAADHHRRWLRRNESRLRHSLD